MGAWGVQFTENDGALDFLGDLGDAKNWSTVTSCLKKYVDHGGYEDAEEALAACELVAAGLGKPSTYLEPDFAHWAASHAQEAKTAQQLAKNAAEMIGSTSELNELWSEADEYAEWQASVENLKSRLG